MDNANEDPSRLLSTDSRPSPASCVFLEPCPQRSSSWPRVAQISVVRLLCSRFPHVLITWTVSTVLPRRKNFFFDLRDIHIESTLSLEFLKPESRPINIFRSFSSRFLWRPRLESSYNLARISKSHCSMPIIAQGLLCSVGTQGYAVFSKV
jgi:hypothetical protein